MISKTFEIRDKGTFIPVLCVKLLPESDKDRFLLARAGYGRFTNEQGRYVLMCQINGGIGKASSDPYSWGGRTYPVAHNYINEHFDDLESGEVIDVEFILGESKEKKLSESDPSYAWPK